MVISGARLQIRNHESGEVMTTPNIEELIDALADAYSSRLTFSERSEARTALSNVLQSKAERIAELESEVGRKSDAVQRLWKERDTQAERIKTLEEQDVQNDYNLEIASRKIEALRAELNTTEVLLEECKMDWSGDVTQIKAEHKHEIDQLRAQLDAIAATEPVYYLGGGRLYGDKTSALFDNAKNAITELFTRPMPAQDVTELVDALENLARLGNGEHYGNSDGNMIARTALSKYKGAK